MRPGAIILKLLIRPLAALPLNFHYAMARPLAWLLHKVFRYRRDTILMNISRSFPKLNYWNIEPVIKDIYSHLAEVIVETIWFGGCRNPKRLRESHIVQISNPEEIARLYDASDGVVFLSSHCGNWELIGGIQEYNYSEVDTHIREDNFCIAYRGTSSKAMGDFLKDNRCAPLYDRKNFPGYLESREVLRYALNHRNEKKFYTAITDQRPYFGIRDEARTDFFFQKVFYMDGAAALAHKLGLSVVYSRMPRKSQGHYSLEYVTICDDASKMEVKDIMRQYFSLLEEDIRQQPANYIWTHHRWWVRDEDWNRV